MENKVEVIYVVALSSENFRWPQNIKTLIETDEINYANYWMNRWKPIKVTNSQKVLIRWENYIIGEARVLEVEKYKLPVHEVYTKYGYANGIMPGDTLDDFIDMLNIAFTSKVSVGRESGLGCLILQDVNILDEKRWYRRPVSNQHCVYIDVYQID